MWRGLNHGEEECRTIPTFFILRNSALAEASFSGSKWRAFAKTGGPGAVGRLWKTPCLGVEAEKLLEERTSGYSKGVSGFLWEPAVDGCRIDRRQLEKKRQRGHPENQHPKP